VILDGGLVILLKNWWWLGESHCWEMRFLGKPTKDGGLMGI